MVFVSSYVWRGLEFESLERLRIDAGAEVRVSSVIDSARGRYSYELLLDADWTFREAHIEALAGERALDIVSDGHGGWTVDGDLRGDLEECIDIDISGTPFTNTLPIRRHPLELDDESDFVMAWIDLDDLSVRPDPQRYTRLDADLYLYESLDSDFEREITVDADGFVVEYPGLFERL